jgi:hypothetical protein
VNDPEPDQQDERPEDAAYAREALERADGQPINNKLDARIALIDATIGVGHALLAIHDQLTQFAFALPSAVSVEFGTPTYVGSDDELLHALREPPADISGIETEQR